jgi:hypothetical protein
MRQFIVLALLSLLTAAVPSTAQPPPRPQAYGTEDPVALVRTWYRQFLDRDSDPAGLASWTQMLRSGQAPAAVLAAILDSPEYYQRSGSTPEGFIRALHLDLTGREAPPGELREWVQRLRTQDRRQIAQAFVQRFPQAWQPPRDGAERDFLAAVREQTRRLIAELEELQEEIVGELRGQKERQLYQRADAILIELRQFQRGLRAGVAREQLARDFGRMDQRLHPLIEDLHALGQERRSLLRAAAQVRQADHELHYALFHGDTSEDNRRQVAQRQARLLLSEARELQRTAQYVLANNRQGQHVGESIDEFVQAADHFWRSAEKEANAGHLRRDFAALNSAWQHVTRDINALPHREGFNYLRSRAQRVDAVHDRLYRHWGPNGDERPRVFYGYDPSR